MSLLRKMLAQVRLDTDVPANGATVKIMKPGCLCTGGATGYALTNNPGALFNYAWVYAIDSDGVAVPNSSVRLDLTDAVTWSATDTAFKVSWASVSPSSTYVPQEGHRLVHDPDLGGAGSYSAFYDNDVGAGTPTTTSFALPSSGKIEGYVLTRDVDVFVTYNDVDTYITDISTDPRDYVTAEDFGATGSASVTDWPYIQNALNYLSYVQEGGELRLGPNAYLVDNATSLTINGDGVSIVGQGPDTSLYYGSGSLPGAILVVADGADDISLRDFTLVHSVGSNTPDETLGLLTIGETDGANGCKRVSVRGLKIKARWTSAIALYGVQGYTLIGNTISNDAGATGGHGILIADTTTTTSKRGIISASQFYDNNTVAGNSAIEIEDGDRVIISDCQFRGWSYGVRVGEGSDSQDVVIDSCEFLAQALDAIHVNNSYTVQRLMILGNKIRTPGERAMRIITDTQGLVLSDNAIYGATKTGIALDYVTYGMVADNNIMDCNTDGNDSATAADVLALQCGITIYANVAYTNFVGNNITETQADGMNYGFGIGSGTANCSFNGVMISDPGGNMVASWYFETAGDKANNSFFVRDPSTDAWHWGDPNGTLGGLRADGTVSLGDPVAGSSYNDLGTHYEDMRVSPTAAAGGGTSPPTLGTFGLGNIETWLFATSPGTEEELFFAVQLPHAYVEASNISPHVHWAPTSTNTGVVRWGLEYSWQNVNGTFAAPTTIYVNDAGSGTTLDHQIAGFADIAGTSKEVSSIIVCRLFRNTGDAADTYTGNAALLSIDFHIQVDSIGSDQIYTKA